MPGIKQVKKSFDRCKRADVYVPVRPPTCGCKACWKKWESGVVPAALTQEEKAVLRHMMNGLLNKEIPPIVGLSFDTVINRIYWIKKKLRAKNRVQAAVTAARNPGLLE